jgi:cation diffusion facilitator family transporter
MQSIDHKRKETKKWGYIEGWLSLFVNTLLFVLKYWAGVVTGSVALIADAWHTLSDSFSSIVVLLGFKFASKPADKDHPYGHGRFELISALIIGVLLVAVGFNFLIESIEHLVDHTEVKYGRLAIIVTAVSIVLKEVMAQFAIRIGKKIKSNSLKADGWHHRTDAISSVVILIGIFIGDYFWWIDGVLGIIVACLIFYTSIEIFKDTFSPLLGEKPDSDLVDKVKKISREVCDRNLNIHHERIHQYGHHTELTFHIELPGDMTLDEAHHAASKLEQRILTDLGVYTTIHMEPTGTHVMKDDTKVIAFNFSDNYHFEMAHQIRNIVFVEEQNVDNNLEFDGFDDSANHYLVFYKEEPIATARWRKTNEGIKLERFAVIKEQRHKGFAKIILDEILKDIAHMNLPIYLNSQATAVGFYQKNGFEIAGEKFVEANIDHYKMIYKKQ